MRYALRLAPFLLAAAPALFGQTPAPAEGDCTRRDFHFASGEALPELRVHYTTLGTPARDAAGKVRNAVLILHGTTGDGKGFLRDQFAGQLFGPGQVLDAANHYIVLPDGIGHGKSSRAPLFAVNSADDEVNPPELGILEEAIHRVPRGRYILLPITPETRGHGTHSLPAVWGKYLAELLATGS